MNDDDEAMAAQTGEAEAAGLVALAEVEGVLVAHHG
jgi:hypothetical protein